VAKSGSQKIMTVKGRRLSRMHAWNGAALDTMSMQYPPRAAFLNLAFKPSEPARARELFDPRIALVGRQLRKRGLTGTPTKVRVRKRNKTIAGSRTRKDV